LAGLRQTTGDAALDGQMGDFMSAWQNEAAGMAEYEGLEGYGGMPEDMEVDVICRCFRNHGLTMDACSRLIRQGWMQSYAEKLKEGGFDDAGANQHSVVMGSHCEASLTVGCACGDLSQG